MNQLIYFGLFDAFNNVLYLIPNPIYNKYGFLGWTLFAKICLFIWLITLFDNKVWAATVNLAITTISQITLCYTIERTLNDRYQLEQEKVGSVDLYIMLYLDVPYLMSSVLWKYRSKYSVISSKYEIHSTKKTN